LSDNSIHSGSSFTCAEGLLGFVKELPCIAGFGDVALYRNGLTALRFDVGDNSVRTLLLEE
jgi:hypothetical protein